MIKINLLPASEAKKRRSSSSGGGGGSQIFAVVLGLLLVTEMAGLYVWYSGIEDQATKARGARNKVKRQLATLEAAKVEWEKRDKERERLYKQNVIFENLEVAKHGPLEALQYLAYALTPKTDTQLTDEIEAHEGAGWSLNWDPGNVWLEEFKQEDDWVTLRGVARTTQDASEFLRRLESSVYYVVPDMPKLEPVRDEVFPERLRLTKFEIEAVMNFNKSGEFRMYRDDMPDSLRKFIKKPTAKKAPPKKAAKAPKKKGK